MHLVSSAVALAGPRAAAQVGQGHFFLNLCCHLPILQQSTTCKGSTNSFNILLGHTVKVILGLNPSWGSDTPSTPAPGSRVAWFQFLPHLWQPGSQP